MPPEAQRPNRKAPVGGAEALINRIVGRRTGIHFA
jgi:hypothetical protein